MGPKKGGTVASDAGKAIETLRASEAHLRLALAAGRMAIDIASIRAGYMPGERERLFEAATSALARGERFFEAEYRYRRPDGEVRWLSMRAEMQMGESGLPERTIGVVFDITDRKRIEEDRERLLMELAEREAELQSALDAASLAIFDFDHVRKVIKPSSRLNRIYGYPPDHVLTIEDIRSRYHPDYAEEMKEIIRGMDNPGLEKMSMELKFLMPDGAVKWVMGQGEYVRDERGRAVRSRGVVMDVTERKQLEETQQLLIAELGHRIKNTLAIVDAIAKQTFRAAESREEAQVMFAARLAALARAHQLLTGSNWRSARIQTVLTEALAAHEDRAGRIRHSGPDLNLTPKQALSLTLAVHELATNAVKYGALSGEGGQVEITWVAEPGEKGLAFRLQWLERGGPRGSGPIGAGFGSKILEGALPQDLGGTGRLFYEPAGLRFELAGWLAAEDTGQPESAA